jgi:hypothetical protein
MRPFLWLAIAITLSGPSYAGGLSTDLKTKLQSAMISYVDNIVVDGSYRYVDAKSGSFTTVYPANVHPIVLTAGADFFVCSEMINEEGDAVTADFLVREIEGAYRVVQMIVNDRASVKSAVNKLN